MEADLTGPRLKRSQQRSAHASEAYRRRHAPERDPRVAVHEAESDDVGVELGDERDVSRRADPGLEALAALDAEVVVRRSRARSIAYHRTPMSGLASQYERQARWRAWAEAISRVPLQRTHRVLDLGCGVGDVAALFHARGAQVIGVDGDEALLSFARARHPGVRFEQTDVRDVVPASFGMVDGIWSSFVAAYLDDLPSVVSRWRACLAPDGWLALVEVDDLLGHEPLPSPMGARIEEFYSIAARRYDFRCGRKLVGAAERAGLVVAHDGVLPDAELSFQGSASAEVLEAWRLRFERMGGLRDFFGADFAALQRAFLDALSSPEHRARCEVRLVVARCPEPR